MTEKCPQYDSFMTKKYAHPRAKIPYINDK